MISPGDGGPLHTQLSIVSMIVLAFLLLSCDILRTAPFSIISWAPGEGFLGEDDDVTLSVTFSEPPSIVRTEQAFSLTENGVPVHGEFNWDGNTMIFIPFSALGKTADFRLSVGLGAMSPAGVSLEEALVGRFTNRAECVRPHVVSTVPKRSGLLTGDMDSVLIEFSEAVDSEHYRSCLSVSPPVCGVWSLDEHGSKAVFSPLEPWSWAVEYTITVSSELSDVSGNRMGRAYTFRFTVGEDTCAPKVIEAWAIDETGLRVASLLPEAYDEEPPVVNDAWERPWRLCVLFSEPVSTRTASSRIVVDGGSALALKTSEAYVDLLCLDFSDPPIWGEHLRVCIRTGIEDACGNASDDETCFRLLCDGIHSRPPRFAGIRLALSPGALVPEDRELTVFSVDSPFQTLAISLGETQYPIGLPVSVSIELYVELATEASLDPFSIMESFGFSASNSALDFYPSRVVLAGLSYAQPYEPWSSYSIARLDGTITNRVNSGVLTLSLAAGFHDASHNSCASTQSLLLLK